MAVVYWRIGFLHLDSAKHPLQSLPVVCFWNFFFQTSPIILLSPHDGCFFKKSVFKISSENKNPPSSGIGKKNANEKCLFVE